jgi:hypothetical protein
MTRLPTKNIWCSGCHRRIPATEPDLVLRKFGEEKFTPLYFHQRERCAGRMQERMLANPDVWRVTHRHVDGDRN